MRRTSLLALFSLPALLSAGCLIDASSPDLGPCAVYPKGVYDYGEIGIGSCLAGPADLRFLDRDGSWTLAVSNSNAFRDFTGGSLLFIDWNSIDLGAEKNLVSELVTRTVEVPHFPGTLGLVDSRSLLVVPIRYSPEARTRVAPDDLYLVDVSDPMNASLAPVGPGGSDRLTVGSDPFATAFDTESGLLFVGNRTDHTISVVDALADPVDLLPVGSRGYVGSERWFDTDRSGSHAEISALEMLAETNLTDDIWRLDWVEGTYLLWAPVAQGLWRYNSGGESWQPMASPEADPSSAELGFESIVDPDFYRSSLGPRLLFTDESSIRSAFAAEYGSDWLFEPDTLLAGRAGEWDESPGGPCGFEHEGYTWLFYDGTSKDQTWIGLASSPVGYNIFQRASRDPILQPAGAHDAKGQSDPYVFYDRTAERWRMFYTAFSGSQYSIGQAWSDDLETWTPDTEPVYEIADTDLLGPVVGYVNGRFVMGLTSIDKEGATWSFVESFDGNVWNPSARLEPIPIDDWLPIAHPRTLAMELQDYGAFRVEGDQAGVQSAHVASGTVVETATYGWRVRVAAGELADLPESGAAERGIAISSVLPDQDLVFAELVDAEGMHSVGVGTWDGTDLVVEPDPVLESGERGDFDAEGVFAPVVFESSDSTLVMLYAGQNNGLVRVGRATSVDGLVWTRESSPVFEVGAEWESLGVVPGSVETLDDGSIRLWYAGTDGSRSRIGAARSYDQGRTFTRESSDQGWLFGTGSPGDWDDSSVRTPYVVAQDELLHLWYSGFDGSHWRVGYALSEDQGQTWVRTGETDDAPRPVLEGKVGLFDYGGLDRPVVIPENGAWTLFYRGYDANLFRPGLARGRDPEVPYKAAKLPTAGDLFTFVTRQANELDLAIALDLPVETFNLMVVGMSALHVDSERGFLVVASKLLPYLVVLDIRDDSSVGFDDTNYLGIETVMAMDGTVQEEGYRSMSMIPGSPYLYVLSSNPDSVTILDISAVEDNGQSEITWNAAIGYLPTPRGLESDKGESTVADAGPTSLAALPDGHTLLVSNFNENSLTAYDLRMGAWGQLVGELSQIGENPNVVAVSPDGRYAVVAVYEGEIRDGAANSQLVVVDADPASPTWLQAVTRIVNQ